MTVILVQTNIKKRLIIDQKSISVTSNPMKHPETFRETLSNKGCGTINVVFHVKHFSQKALYLVIMFHVKHKKDAS